MYERSIIIERMKLNTPYTKRSILSIPVARYTTAHPNAIRKNIAVNAKSMNRVIMLLFWGY